jgi:hypothetical protein
MRSVRRGKRIAAVEVTNVSTNGFWMLLEEEEVFIAFRKFPWFRDATIGELTRVEHRRRTICPGRNSTSIWRSIP